jgi:putative glutamine amidotransferase
VPVIAIAPCSKPHDYEAAIERAGGEILRLDRGVHRPADVITSAAGLMLPGGGDILPSLYGEAAHPAFSAAESGRDDYELELVRRALEANLPVLGICRGVQVLNVACGGSLVQHIPDQVGTSVNHVLREPPHAIAHDVWVTSGSMLETLMRETLDGDTCPVNSRHHQAPAALGKGLVASATAPDGVIEAIENPSKRFCLGVLWHPENFYRTGEFRALFEGLVNAAGGATR